jgi:hypothetical protein
MLETETDMLRTLASGTYKLEQLYELGAERLDLERDRGLEPPTPRHPTDARWKHRLRSALASLQRQGQAARIARSTWLIHGSVQRPRRMLLIDVTGTLCEVELRMQDAIALLASLEEPCDLVLTDPPYGLGRQRGDDSEQPYARDSSKILGGYVDVDPEAYEDFTRRWVAAAAQAMRPGGQLVCVTGSQRAAVVQCVAEQVGLNWVCSIPAKHEFALYSRRRPSVSAYWMLTVMCRGPVGNPLRTFNVAPDLPKAASGNNYPLAWWTNNGRADRPGLLRYDNALPQPLVDRAVFSFSDPGALIVDPYVGSGTTVKAALRLGRRCLAGDLNPEAVRFTAASLLDEHLWPAERQPALFDLDAA